MEQNQKTDKERKNEGRERDTKQVQKKKNVPGKKTQKELPDVPKKDTKKKPQKKMQKKSVKKDVTKKPGKKKPEKTKSSEWTIRVTLPAVILCLFGICVLVLGCLPLREIDLATLPGWAGVAIAMSLWFPGIVILSGASSLMMNGGRFNKNNFEQTTSVVFYMMASIVVIMALIALVAGQFGIRLL